MPESLEIEFVWLLVVDRHNSKVHRFALLAGEEGVEMEEEGGKGGYGGNECDEGGV